MTDKRLSQPFDEFAELVPVESSEDRAESQSDAVSPAASRDVAELQKQCDDYYDLLLRKTAEFDNYRKRTERERKELVETAAAGLLAELLPVIDDLERALVAADAGVNDVEAYRKGVELIHRQVLDLLRKRGVKSIEAVGKPFDPHFHQAVAYEMSPEHGEGQVISELRRGYLMGDRLLRPAMVKVAKA